MCVSRRSSQNTSGQIRFDSSLILIKSGAGGECTVCAASCEYELENLR